MSWHDAQEFIRSLNEKEKTDGRQVQPMFREGRIDGVDVGRRQERCIEPEDRKRNETPLLSVCLSRLPLAPVLLSSEIALS